MDKNFISTITVPLAQYDAMKQEIKDLKLQLQQKTIVKYKSRWDDYLDLLVAVIAIGSLIFSLVWITVNN